MRCIFLYSESAIFFHQNHIFLMYVYIYIHVYICVHIYIYISIYLYIYVSAYLCSSYIYILYVSRAHHCFSKWVKKNHFLRKSFLFPIFFPIFFAQKTSRIVSWAPFCALSTLDPLIFLIPSSLPAQPDFSGKVWFLKPMIVCIDSGWMQVARGGSGVKAPLLAARPPVRGWYHGIGRFASNIPGRAGLPLKEQRAHGGKRNEPAHRWWAGKCCSWEWSQSPPHRVQSRVLNYCFT